MKATFATLALACGLAAARQATTKEEILQLEKSNTEAHLCEFDSDVMKAQCLHLPGYTQDKVFGTVDIESACPGDYCVDCVKNDQLTVEKQQPGTYLYECGAKDKDMFPPVSAAEPIQLLMRWAAKFCHEEHGHTVTAAQECIETYDKCTEPLKGEDQFADDFEEKTREVVNKCLKDTG
ncbi:hypothetical protein PLIIFM63780_007244 [Purpureocillium lilacinum]|nr:hypothetical protein PLIIFM63780_007244 [Purpureocillium lilacinum]